MPLVIRKDLWNKLSASEQKIVKDAALKAQKLNRDIVKKQTESLVADLKKAGMTVTSPNLAEFSKATKSVLDDFSAVYGKSLMTKVQNFTK